LDNIKDYYIGIQEESDNYKFRTCIVFLEPEICGVLI